MPQYISCAVLRNDEISGGVFDMTVENRLGQIKPGQFAELYTGRGEHILPRPISVCDFSGDEIRFVYRVAGSGTEIFSALRPGDEITLLGPLGSGFPVDVPGRAAMVGGGIGIPPLVALYKALKGCDVHVFLGYQSELFLQNEFDYAEISSEKVHLASDSGGHTAFKGNVVELMRREALDFDVIYACGPKPMLRALNGYASEKGCLLYVSLEERMACGLGTCCGCAVSVISGTYKKVCKDGPVFDSREVDWLAY